MKWKMFQWMQVNKSLKADELWKQELKTLFGNKKWFRVYPTTLICEMTLDTMQTDTISWLLAGSTSIKLLWIVLSSVQSANRVED